MSKENVEVVRAAIDAYNRGDLDAVLKEASPDLEIDLSRAVGPQHGVFRLDQIERFADEFSEAWESVRLEPHEFIEAGDHVVVPWTVHVEGRDGIEVRSRVAWVFTFRGGRVQRACMYQDRQGALEAVGLSE
jgi:ketosteroid isomerase-like protein